MKICLCVVVAIAVAILCMNADGKVFLEKEEALQYLKRAKRSNSQFLEEVYQGNIERECVEEVCDYEEAREAFENDVQTAAYWRLLTEQCKTWHNHCNDTGTLRCESGYNSLRCVCKEGYTGSNCETEVNECDFGYCPEGSECEDLVNSFRCNCPPAGCLAFLQDQDEYGNDL